MNSYDYESPVTEYGLVRIDKFPHLSLLHYILQQYSSIIIDSDMAINRQQQLSDSVLLLDYGNSLFGLLFFVNTDDSPTTAKWQGQTLSLAGTSVQMRDWSTFELLYDSSNVSMSLDAIRAAHIMDAYITPSTTQSKAQTAYNVAYIAEPHSIYQWDGVVESTEPLELINLAQYDSDHVFYQTNVTLTKQQLQAGTILVNVTNAVEHFHLFFNGGFIGFSATGSDAFSVSVSGLSGSTAYVLTLVVQMDGVTNCCGGLESFAEGLQGDIAVDAQSILSAGWQQLVGLQGERSQLYLANTTAAWTMKTLYYTPFIWYRMDILTPQLTADAPPFATYALDLTSTMGKGAGVGQWPPLGPLLERDGRKRQLHAAVQPRAGRVAVQAGELQCAGSVGGAGWRAGWHTAVPGGVL